MANFLIVIDPDPERRSQFVQTIIPHLPPIEGLTIDRAATENICAIWAANPRAPISWVAESDEVAVVWGDAIAPDTSQRIDARQLKEQWRNLSTANTQGFNGFYAGATYHPQRGLTVGADLLGLFPIYYYTQGEVALVTSSPELLRHHPLLTAKFNPVGLVGILLTNGLVDGQTLWQDVRRLRAAHLLTWQPNTPPREIQQFPNPIAGDEGEYKKGTFADHLEILDRTIDRAIATQAPSGSPYCLLLSGGLDSRMIGGYLRRQGVDPVALTMGIQSDIEMQCALPVARHLGFEHRKATIPFQEYPDYADLFTQWEHLANGGNTLKDWAYPARVAPLAPKVITGRAMGPIAGNHLQWAYSRTSKTYSFDALLAKFNTHGISPQRLEKLLRPDVFKDLVPETLNRIREIYQSYSEVESQRIWSFYVYHRDRFHIGAFAWQISFGAWPVLPILDWQLLSTTARLPASTLDKRRAQNQLLCQQFPELARLPLDRNDFNVDPLLPTKTRQRLARLFRLQLKWRRLLLKLGYDRRYYFRIYDINNAGWTAVRQKAEPYRAHVQHLFCDDVLRDILPPPEIPLQLGFDPIPEASGAKALLGFLLWSKDNL